MTIDVHVHIGSYPSVESAGEKLTTRPDVAKFRNKYPELYKRYVTEEPLDNSGTLLRVMDEYEVSRSFVQARPGISNDFVAKMANENAERLTALAVPTPWPTPADGPELNEGDLSTRAADLLRYCLDDLGMKAAGELYVRRATNEIHPEKIADDLSPMMEILEVRKGSVQIPTAWTQFPGNLFYGDPLWVDELANRFPNVPILLTKMGRGLTRYFEASMVVALRNANVYFDTSDTKPEQLKAAIEAIGPERIMYGTDWSATWQFMKYPGTAHSIAFDTVEASTNDPGIREQILVKTAEEFYATALAK